MPSQPYLTGRDLKMRIITFALDLQCVRCRSPRQALFYEQIWLALGQPPQELQLGIKPLRTTSDAPIAGRESRPSRAINISIEGLLYVEVSVAKQNVVYLVSAP